MSVGVKWVVAAFFGDVDVLLLLAFMRSVLAVA